MPSYWERCGRCGQLLHKGRRSRIRGWAFFILLTFVVFIFRGHIIRLAQDHFYMDNKRNISSQDNAKGIPDGDGIKPIPAEPADFPDPDENSDLVNDPSFIGTTPDPEEIIELADPKPDSISGELKETANLTYDQKLERIYDLIVKALKNVEEQVILPVLGTGDDSRIVFGIIEKIILDNPEIMFYEGGRYRSDGQLTLKYSKSRDFILSAVQTTIRTADEILDEIIQPGMNDFEKELAIHDYIVNNCRYDIENLKEGTSPPEDYTAYGVLVNGMAVCEGYAKAMKLMLDRVNIPSLVVAGYSKGERHAWNIVCLDGEYYHVDATWNDPVMAGGEQILSHVYFNLTDQDIQRDHSWDRAAYPQCYGTTYNYYHYYGLAVASSHEFNVCLEDAVKGGKDRISLRITNYDEDSYDVPKLIQEAANAWGLWSLYYSVNDLYGVVDIWLK